MPTVDDIHHILAFFQEGFVKLFVKGTVAGIDQIVVYLGAMDQILELDLSDMDNLFLVSTDGYSVRLGNSENLHAKLRAMLMTLDWLRQEGYGAGTVDVSVPVNPTYIPESA